MIQPLILCIETSTTICSVALSKGNELINCIDDSSGDHVKVLPGLIYKVFESSDHDLFHLKALAVSIGPGSYTALRAGLALAKGLSMSLDIPIIAIPTLTGLAQGASQGNSNAKYIISCLDARRSNIYSQVFDVSLSAQTNPEFINLDEPMEAWLDYLKHPVCFVGNGAIKCKSMNTNELNEFKEIECSARYLIHLANEAYTKQNFAAMDSLVPEYMREPNITQAKQKLPNSLN